ncbi:MAG: hypothetical protein A2583_00085 [Bdellovibrionales bacterium RIFOXYD1_FULL_53_11]|nr:MAG: hypothetical protein A2583_00085 [Bdellovibrionales bacterium RIFOXYD1_FULL_53_11]
MKGFLRNPARASLVIMLLVAAWCVLGASAPDRGRSSKKQKTDAIRTALTVLMDLPSGRRVISNMMLRWQLPDEEAVAGIFKWGNVSKTDAVLTRHFDPETGREQRERLVTIYIKRGQSKADLVLDVAHELTHAASGPQWDPYDPELTAARYVWISLEGDGGEIDALITECRVAGELGIVRGATAARCMRYRVSEEPALARDRIREDLYRVGSARNRLVRMLGLDVELFPFLSDRVPRLFSSTGNAPYPLALAEEYDELTRIACSNSEKRLARINGRDPASATDLAKKITSFFLARRCRGV